jgi:hypothetical protein
MISAVSPGTVGCGQGSAAEVPLEPLVLPNPAPPEVALALGVAVHWPGPCVVPV